eukprot:9398_1
MESAWSSGIPQANAASWCKGYPEVCPSTSCTQPLNPATPATFQLTRTLPRGRPRR